ncbi:transposase [Vibrio alginolyticus]|nr:transposase [Vibrio alginolyticus]EMA9138546.1 transposase [Vibrio alginolyticus]
MHQALLKEPAIHGDETTLQVLKEPNKKAENKSYLWAYASPEHSLTPVTLFEYQPRREHNYPKQFLNKYAGSIMADGYSARRMLDNVQHLGCWARVRSKFKDALDLSPKIAGQAKLALSYIPKLYTVEKKGKNLSSDERCQLRQKEAVPILTAFYA